MEIKVGDYIKADGSLYKVLDMDNVFLYVDKEVRYSEEYNASIHYIKRDEVEKHSPNIIDLIEVGDYVNGKEVLRINDYGDFKRADFNLDYDDCDAVYNEDIKSIVTKEMMKNVMYEV